ncbi:MAG: hypothetical protein ABIN94_19285 [Ferruginibacter sp.]
MISIFVNRWVVWLQKDNYKSFYLAFLRVAVSCWLLKEVAINWQGMEILYGQSALVPYNVNGPALGIPFIKSHYQWFMGLYVSVIILNILGIGRWFTALLLYLLVQVLQKMNMPFINGGDLMARLVMFYMIFANTYHYFVLNKDVAPSVASLKIQNLLSNLAALSIMLQLCVAYWGLALTKIMDPYWFRGEAVYYALSVERFMGTPLNKVLLQYGRLTMVINYAVILFELLFPILIWVKKLRKPLLIAGLVFHASIYILLMIYGFQIVFVLLYGLFLPNQQLLNFGQKIRVMLR